MAEGKDVRDDRKYSKEHEWAKVEGDSVLVGISDFAQNSLHEITYVEVSEAGTTVAINGECGLIESMKASSEIYSPIAGEITEVNSALEDAPELVNESPYEKGWLYRIKPSNLEADLDGLMDAKAYSEYTESL